LRSYASATSGISRQRDTARRYLNLTTGPQPMHIPSSRAAASLVPADPCRAIRSRCTQSSLSYC
jgi:hypothetical protein